MTLHEYIIGYVVRLYGAKYSLYEYVLPDKFRTLCKDCGEQYNFGQYHFVFRVPDKILKEFGHTDRDDVLGRLSVSLLEQDSCAKWLVKHRTNDLFISEKCIDVFKRNRQAVTAIIANDASWHAFNAKFITWSEAYLINEFVKFKLIKRVI